jgi:anti-sigma factor RsiW
MAKLTQELLQKYVDGELPPHQIEKVKSILASSPEDELVVQELTKIGSLLRIMDEETTAAVSFEGLAEKVLAEVKTTRTSLSFSEKLSAWFSEFFEHRRSVWIPASAAVCAACLTVAIFPLFSTVQNGVDTGIVLHSTAAEKGSRIAAVDFGSQTGVQYALDDGRGNAVGVVWIVEDK